MKQVRRWDTTLKVGAEILDDQHKILFDLANDLNNAVNTKASKNVVNTLFSVITNYAFKHFETEEGFIKGHPDYNDHCFRHYQLLKQLHVYALDYRNNRKAEVPPGEFLENWLLDHIRECDIPTLATRNNEMPTFPEIDRFDDFDSSEIDRRRHKRVRFEQILDDEIVGHCYNANTMRTGTVKVVDLASGGLKIAAEQKIEIDDLLVISCRVGTQFRLKEKARVKNVNAGEYGVEFVAPKEETVRFLAELCGAVQLQRT